MERSSLLGVRKGAWSKDEDDLLKACVQQYGEGKWHLVPQRTGLNRCRKSCRLRWLNYLKPDIKRGDFTKDEVDLMIRLHKLLGNRWSLIAGRLPGRTANDVKNYSNTYLRKKAPSHHKEDSNNVKPEAETVKPHIVIKPQPRTFSKTHRKLFVGSAGASKEGTSHNQEACAASSESRNWSKWCGGTVQEDKGGNGENNEACSLGGKHGVPTNDLWDDEELSSMTIKDGDFLVDGQSWSDFHSDINLWDS